MFAASFSDMKKITGKMAIALMRLEFLLRGSDYLSVDRLGELLNVSSRTAYRYIEALKSENRALIENKDNTYRISEENDSGIIQTSEELLGIYDAIKSNKLSEDQSKKLLKLVTQSTVMWVDRNPLDEKKDRNIITVIEKSLENKKRFFIKPYKSRDSSASARIVTPVLLDKENRRVYGLENGQRKTFNFENMLGKVELTKTKAEDAKGWDPTDGKDVFGFIQPSDDRQAIEVEVAMTPFAHSQLIRQFPQMRKHISDNSKNDKEYLFIVSIKVWDIQPIARFCTGLLHAVKIVGSEEAIKKIKAYADEKVFRDGYSKNFSTI